MKLLLLGILLFFMSFGMGRAQTGNDRKNDTIVHTPRNIPMDRLPFINQTDNNPTHFVLVFLGTDCPISQKYMHTLRSLHETHASGIRFIGIIPENFSEEKIITFKDTYSVPFQLVRDLENQFAITLDASVTPEAFLLNKNGDLLYEGAIDNWFFALGRNRLKASEHYLEDAIKSVTSGTKIDTPQTKAVGCFIEFRKK
jgi:thiol-disulfide isomerase/thioredoxin